MKTETRLTLIVCGVVFFGMSLYTNVVLLDGISIDKFDGKLHEFVYDLLFNDPIIVLAIGLVAGLNIGVYGQALENYLKARYKIIKNGDTGFCSKE